MSNEVERAYAIAFDTNFRHLSQQTGSRLEECVTVSAGVVGRAKDFNLVGATTASKKTSRNAVTPIVNTPHGKRRAFLETYNWGDTVEEADKIRLLSDPTSEYLRAGLSAMGRAKDDIIIAALLGSSTSVTLAADSVDTLTAVTLPSAQKIVHGSAGLTIAKLLAAKEIIDAADVDPDIERYCALTAGQVTDLLNTTEIKSVDYNNVKALSQGKLDTFLGFKFVRSQRLTEDATPDRQVICFTKNALCLAIGLDMKTKVAERADLSFAMQLYAEMDMGATRVEEKMVVEIACEE